MLSITSKNYFQCSETGLTLLCSVSHVIFCGHQSCHNHDRIYPQKQRAEKGSIRSYSCSNFRYIHFLFQAVFNIRLGLATTGKPNNRKKVSSSSQLFQAQAALSYYNYTIFQVHNVLLFNNANPCFRAFSPVI